MRHRHTPHATSHIFPAPPLPLPARPQTALTYRDGFRCGRRPERSGLPAGGSAGIARCGRAGCTATARRSHQEPLPRGDRRQYPPAHADGVMIRVGRIMGSPDARVCRSLEVHVKSQIHLEIVHAWVRRLPEHARMAHAWATSPYPASVVSHAATVTFGTLRSGQGNEWMPS